MGKPMSLNDYNPSAALNTLLATIPVGPGMAREKVNDAIQQQMADLAGLPSYTFTPTGESAAVALASATRPLSPQRRCRINYNSVSTIAIFPPPFLVMGGFRIFGNYLKDRAPRVASGVNGKGTLSFLTDLAYETTAEVHNWYGVFACANNGDASTTYKLVPFLRVGSVAGSVCTLNYAGESTNAHSIVAATYTFTANNMAGVECLVITESGGGWSGRTTTITANTTTTVTLGTIGTVAAYDFLLPAPAGFTHYAYLGSVYWETEPRNIADSGESVTARMINTQDPLWPAAGAVASPGVKVNFAGYISPLATGVLLASVETLSTATVSGASTTYFSHDGSAHDVAQHFIQKEDAANHTSVDRFPLNFSIGQHCYVYTAGTLQATRSGCTLEIKGWIEP
jgi:hypothetical protein